jgi:hypothetical protein
MYTFLLQPARSVEHVRMKHLIAAGRSEAGSNSFPGDTLIKSMFFRYRCQDLLMPPAQNFPSYLAICPFGPQPIWLLLTHGAPTLYTLGWPIPRDRPPSVG